ncbi:MAG: HU family DNA-binding protein [Moritella sp.]|uniref:HU family DNA-binding protein n=1 Tax=Moritella sp. TaxID=78556 RepID=UPI001D8843C3|nr:HU family DNA-binding protein [Moritella sp.]NQZ49665.1 HU family DNA-binding protein [Moritella sp.]
MKEKAWTKLRIVQEIINPITDNSANSVILLDSILRQIEISLLAGIDVLINYSGRLTVIHKNERPGRNPKTGEDIPVTARTVVSFTKKTNHHGIKKPKVSRSKIISSISEELSDIPFIQVDTFVRSFFNLIAEVRTHGHRIEIRDFGVFSQTFKEARSGRNPKTGDKVLIQRKAYVHFKLGKGLSNSLNAAFPV